MAREDVLVRMSAQDAGMVRAWQESEKGAEKVAKSVRKIKGESESANVATGGFLTSMGRGFDATLRQIGSVVVGLYSIQTAISTVSDLLDRLAEKRRQAGEESRQAAGPYSRLGQIATSDQGMGRLVGLAKQTFAEGAVDTLPQASELVFQLESANVLHERPFFSRLASSGLVQYPAKMATAVGTIMTSFGEEAGGAKQVVSEAFGAGRLSPSTAEELLDASAKGAPGAEALGWQTSELLAANSVLGLAMGDQEEAGTAFASFVRSIEKEAKHFAAPSLDETLDKIAASGLEGEDFFKAMHRQEAARAYRILRKQQGLYRGIEQETRDAGDANVAEDKIRFAESAPGARAALNLRREKAARQLEDEDIGEVRNYAESIMQARVAELHRQGNHTQAAIEEKLTTHFRDGLGQVLPGIGGDANYIKHTTGVDVSDGISPAERSELDRQIAHMNITMESLNYTMKELQRAVEEQNKQNGQPAAAPAPAINGHQD